MTVEAPKLRVGLAPALAAALAAPLDELRTAIVWDLRLPRILAAAGIGASLGLAGAVMQALTRNPLADPFLLGLSSGAALGAVTFLTLGATLLIPLGAFLGAAAAMSLTLTIAHLLGGTSPSRAILAGIAISSVASALTSLAIFWSATGDSYREILAWLLVALAVSVIGLPLVLAARSLDAFTFGETSAAALGVDVARTRRLLLIGSALLTGLLVSVAGTIGFVGLVVPHMVRLVAGSSHRVVLPLTMLVGAVFMVWTDTAARSLFSPRELPVGIVTALIGAPAFIAVMFRNRRLT